MTKQDLQNLLAQNRIEEIFKTLLQSNEVIMLKSRWNEYQRNSRLNLVDPGVLGTERNQIVEAIFQIINHQFGDGTVVENITVNVFSEPLKTVEGVENLFETLNRRNSNFELTSGELRSACETLFNLTEEEVFMEIHDIVKTAERKKFGISDAMTSALNQLNSLKEEIVGFLRNTNKEKKEEKTIFTCLNNFDLAPGKETFEALKVKAEEVFSSDAFYDETVRQSLQNILRECPGLSEFGFKKKVHDWVPRMKNWLEQNYKG